jgi:hypothetical protein
MKLITRCCALSGAGGGKSRPSPSREQGHLVRTQHMHDSAGTPVDPHGKIIHPTSHSIIRHRPVRPSLGASMTKQGDSPATIKISQPAATFFDLAVGFCAFVLQTANGEEWATEDCPSQLVEYSGRCRFRVVSGPLQGVDRLRRRWLEWRPASFHQGKQRVDVVLALGSAPEISRAATTGRTSGSCSSAAAEGPSYNPPGLVGPTGQALRPELKLEGNISYDRAQSLAQGAIRNF